ncbi:hypothetical protein E4U35_000610 [Claviceps purpurea]|uniref:Uncharacterized protein n=1 Tax=Claviceps purpurea (strain 20.1) TaxID=1111077 RepID=M1W1C0_CLAP2|nr:hypothetical protein E4U27_001013 [Claviceps purpurea]KAG6186772.1 hypothetical protein E4U36_000372 [Claviceps purpurea]KAG6194395.1 hypothetical protein E4U35_000610 [Claviceps purpurea]KAG6283500.1 hypothetical protein E4U48_000095 [Claviceps purpurea]CCE26655.1 uncharacterized protein CPUR_00124 [Claviceps purpurea 20.1]
MASIEKFSCPPQKIALKPPLPTSTHVESSKSKADVRHNLPANQPRVETVRINTADVAQPFLDADTLSSCRP